MTYIEILEVIEYFHGDWVSNLDVISACEDLNPGVFQCLAGTVPLVRVHY